MPQNSVLFNENHGMTERFKPSDLPNIDPASMRPIDPKRLAAKAVVFAFGCARSRAPAEVARL